MKTKPSWVVIKFGGTSVKDRIAWNHIVSIIQNHQRMNHHVLVVCSAPYRVSNLLETLIRDAINQQHIETFHAIQLIYQSLAQELEVDFEVLDHDFTYLKQLCEGIALLQEVSAKIRAKILSLGELMLTRLGFLFLEKQFDLSWQDAREILVSLPAPVAESGYLTAVCQTSYDERAVKQLDALNKRLVITQGFIASNPQGETVLLGRGGSDTSASYFAAKLNAKACEIWTDVPGIYTANPHVIPESRLLKKLSYLEAQEIALLGAKVLHPLCIPPLMENKIPLYVKQTAKPEHEGTFISPEGEGQTIPIKAIITRHPVLLVSIESDSMWGQAGFLADVFMKFKKYHLSVNLLSTSETNLTLSLDPSHHQVNQNIEALLAELNQFAKASLIGPCASISLVGREIRSVLPQVSHLFEVFAQQKVYLLSQAANDLNLTFVVDEAQAEHLAKKLHALLIEQNPHSLRVGKSWLEEQNLMSNHGEAFWWKKKKKTLLAIAKNQSPVYVYDEETLSQSADKLLQCQNVSRIFYAMKANPYPDILKLFEKKGIHFECVSIEEIEHLLSVIPTLDKNRILFTPNFAPRAEYEAAIALGVVVTIDSLFPLQHWPSLFKNQSLFIRIDPGQGSGHHKYVRTGGNESKFGIPQSELPELANFVRQHHIHIVGLHAHHGSGILNTNLWHETAKLLVSHLELFPEVKTINLGGGFGVVERPGQQELNLQTFNDSLTPIRNAYPQLDIWIEPGRYLVAASGVLLAKVTQVKQKEDTCFVGVETGMNSLIRPALYGSYHEIANLSHLGQPNAIIANVVGPICESGDTLGYSRPLPDTQEGDVLIIANAGAYGHCMSSNYNLRSAAQEYFLVALGG